MVDKTKEEKLLKKIEDLERFGYIVSHDLQSPLRSLDSLVEWLEEDAADVLDENSSKHLEMIKTQVTKLNKLFAGVLEYSRIGRLKTEVHAVNFNSVIITVAEQLKMKEQVDVVGSLPDLKMNKERAEQMLSEVLSNSKKYCDPVVVKIKLSESDSEYILEFEDNGGGVPEKHLTRLTEIFQTLGQPKDGIGAGLAFASKICEYYDGSLKLTNLNNGLQTRLTLSKKLTCI